MCAFRLLPVLLALLLAATGDIIGQTFNAGRHSNGAFPGARAGLA